MLDRADYVALQSSIVNRQSSIRILVLADYPLARAGLAALLVGEEAHRLGAARIDA